jgi:hypothetical protein
MRATYGDIHGYFGRGLKRPDATLERLRNALLATSP